jgi:hypothetical protein
VRRVAATRAAQGRDTQDREYAEDSENTQDREDTAAREGIVDQLATKIDGSGEEEAAGYRYQDDIIVVNIE